jgi:hypothetical protein
MNAFARIFKAPDELKRSRLLLFTGLASLLLGLAGCSASIAWSTANSAGMMAGGMMGGGMNAQPLMVWRNGTGAVSSPQEAARLGLETVHQRGWTWLTLDEVHIFPAFYEVEFNDRHDFKGPEIYVSRSSGAVGPEMGPNMMWDSQYGMGATCSSLTEDQARALVTGQGGLAVGDGERHHGYWEFELKRGNTVVNQVNVSECAGHSVINEQAWQPDMQGTYAPHG